MAIEGKTTVKSWFETGDKPTETQFSSWIDSGVFHPAAGNFGWIKTLSTAESTAVANLEISDVSGLAATLSGNAVVFGLASAAFNSTRIGIVGVAATASVTAWSSAGILDVTSTQSAATTTKTLTAWLSALQAFQEARALFKIATVSAASTSQVVFTGLSTAYSSYILEFEELLSSVTGNSLLLRTSTDGGSTFGNTANTYTWGNVQVVVTAGATQTAGSRFEGMFDSSIVVGQRLGAEQGFEAAGNLKLQQFNGLGFPTVTGECFIRQLDQNVYIPHHIGGQRAASDKVNAIQFIMASGSIKTGVFHLYGMRKIG